MFGQALTRTATHRALTQGAAGVLGGAGLAVLVGILYRGVLPAWIEDLWIDPNYSHGLLVPFAAAWLAYQRRDRLAALVPRPAASALLIVLGGFLLLAFGLLAAELFVTRLSLLVLLTGLVAFILGYQYVRVLALPLVFLLFMVPLPALVLNAIALPLQLTASQVAITVLQGLGVPALREGNVILLPNVALEVVEACSGLRSLVSLAAMGVLVAALTLRGTSARVLLIASSIPVAVLTNGMRVSGTGMLAYYFGPGVANGFFHAFSGWVVFVVALVLLAIGAGTLRRLEGQP